jgi:hypothetical protein
MNCLRKFKYFAENKSVGELEYLGIVNIKMCKNSEYRIPQIKKKNTFPSQFDDSQLISMFWILAFPNILDSHP